MTHLGEQGVANVGVACLGSPRLALLFRARGTLGWPAEVSRRRGAVARSFAQSFFRSLLQPCSASVQRITPKAVSGLKRPMTYRITVSIKEAAPAGVGTPAEALISLQ